MCLMVTGCCFCFNLDVGTKIVTVLSLMASTATMTLYGGAAVLPWMLPPIQKAFYIAVAMGSAVQIVAGCIMIYGAFWTKPRYLMPWLITSWVSASILLSLSVLGTVLLMVKYSGDTDTSAEVSTMISFYFVYAMVTFYFTSVVYSRREEMVVENETESSLRLMRQRDLPKALYA